MSTQLLTEPDRKTYSGNPATVVPGPGLPAGVQLRPMFSQSLVELSDIDRRRRRASQASSFVVQAIIVGLLVILPLWFIDVLPVQSLATFLVAPPPPPPPPAPAAPTVKITRVSQVVNGELRAPSRIPEKVKMIKEEEAPPSASSGVIGGVEGGVPGGTVSGVLGSLITVSHTMQPPAVAPARRIRVSTGISEGMLTRRVEPVYPIIAQRARVQGTVEMKALISKQGTIENLQLVSGHPLLVPAAMEAVKQWRYRPYVLNGEPLEVETMVIVNFHMN